jgi:SNF2 family DNA or RNA helicase
MSLETNFTSGVGKLVWHPAIHTIFHPWIRLRIKSILLSLYRLNILQHKGITYRIIREFVRLEHNLIQPSPKMMYVYKLLTEHKKIIVFATFKTFLENIMQPWFRQVGVLSVLFCGGNRKIQEKALRTFEKEEDVRLLLIVKTAGAEGLNLQKMANVCVIMDPHFNMALDEQAAQRIDRIGQENEVIVRKLYMKGSIDEAIKKMQEEKQLDIEAWNKKDNIKTIRTHGLFLQKYDTVK